MYLVLSINSEDHSPKNILLDSTNLKAQHMMSTKKAHKHPTSSSSLVRQKKISKSESLKQNIGFPVQLVDVGSDGKLTWNQESLKYFGSYQKIATISIVGCARKGKSTILSRLIGLPPSQGFQVGSTNRPITMGIWFFSKPMLIGDVSVFFLDSEGSSSLQASGEHDKNIQTLIWNLSSMILYNSVGLIDEAAISDISLICLVSKVLSDAIQGDEKNIFIQDTPSFIWLLRDGGSIQLVDQETKQPIDAPEYLEQALTPRNYFKNKKRKSTNSASQENDDNTELLNEGDGNKSREAIRKTFCKNRWCIVLNRPTDDDKLPFVSSLPDSELSPIFVEQLKKLKNYIVSHLNVKTYRGKPLAGWGWCELGEKFVQALNEKRIPSIENHTATLLRMGLERAISEVKRKWKEFCHSWMLILTQERKNCTTESLLEAGIKSWELQLSKDYQSFLFGGETEETKQHWKLLVEELKQDLLTFQKANAEGVRAMIQSQLQNLFASFDVNTLPNWEDLKKQEDKTL